MRIFISWSGTRSRAVAEALREWLPEVIQSIRPWMSDSDIRAGERWTAELNTQLSQTKFGVICLTQENQHGPWIMFEAGALAKTLKDAFVVPYLINMEPSDLKGPLSQFQAKRANKQGTLELVRSINRSLGVEALENGRLDRQFERAWPGLEKAFGNLPEPENLPEVKRPSEEILREVLELVRDISRRMPDDPVSAKDVIRSTAEGHDDLAVFRLIGKYLFDSEPNLSRSKESQAFDSVEEARIEDEINRQALAGEAEMERREVLAEEACIEDEIYRAALADEVEEQQVDEGEDRQ